VIVSWLGLEPGNPVVVFIHDITEPILAPIRQFMPRMGMLDLSPLIAIIVLQLIGRAALMFLS
jgi:YggT family protein